jgi:hypothetical protein|tara:strand:+ start:3440 stop:3607 length:168 start_codon:yes stop_codon:yes gene_type:complete
MITPNKARVVTIELPPWLIKGRVIPTTGNKPMHMPIFIVNNIMNIKSKLPDKIFP